jgi:hypothetical protein
MECMCVAYHWARFAALAASVVCRGLPVGNGYFATIRERDQILRYGP